MEILVETDDDIDEATFRLSFFFLPYWDAVEDDLINGGSRETPDDVVKLMNTAVSDFGTISMMASILFFFPFSLIGFFFSFVRIRAASSVMSVSFTGFSCVVERERERGETITKRGWNSLANPIKVQLNLRRRTDFNGEINIGLWQLN